MKVIKESKSIKIDEMAQQATPVSVVLPAYEEQNLIDIDFSKVPKDRVFWDDNSSGVSSTQRALIYMINHPSEDLISVKLGGIVSSSDEVIQAPGRPPVVELRSILSLADIDHGMGNKKEIYIDGHVDDTFWGKRSSTDNIEKALNSGKSVVQFTGRINKQTPWDGPRYIGGPGRRNFHVGLAPAHESLGEDMDKELDIKNIQESITTVPEIDNVNTAVPNVMGKAKMDSDEAEKRFEKVVTSPEGFDRKQDAAFGAEKQPKPEEAEKELEKINLDESLFEEIIEDIPEDKEYMKKMGLSPKKYIFTEADLDEAGSFTDLRREQELDKAYNDFKNIPRQERSDKYNFGGYSDDLVYRTNDKVIIKSAELTARDAKKLAHRLNSMADAVAFDTNESIEEDYVDFSAEMEPVEVQPETCCVESEPEVCEDSPKVIINTMNVNVPEIDTDVINYVANAMRECGLSSEIWDMRTQALCGNCDEVCDAYIVRCNEIAESIDDDYVVEGLEFVTQGLNINESNDKELEELRDKYLGKTILIKQMVNPDSDIDDSKYNNTKGKVTGIDGIGQLHGTWGGLAVIPGIDEFEVIG